MLRESIQTVVCLALAMGLSVATRSPAVPSDTDLLSWTSENIEAPPTFEVWQRGVAMDALHQAHIVYGEDRLYFALFNDPSFTLEVIDARPGVGDTASVAVDSSGNTHVGYADEKNGDALYATNASGSWVLTTVEEDLGAGVIGTSIAVDSQGKAHLVYFDPGEQRLRYATNASGAWVAETVTDLSGSEPYPSLAVNADGVPHIAVFRGNPSQGVNSVEHFAKVWGTWTGDVVEQGMSDEFGIEDTMGGRPSIALDSGGIVHISYYADFPTPTIGRAVRWAHNTGGTWTKTTIGSGGYTNGPYGTSLAIAANDDVHIAWNDVDDELIRYAIHDGATLKTDIVTSSTAGGVALALTTDGFPRLVTRQGPYLLFAYGAFGSWSTRAPVQRVGAGRGVSLALMPSGDPAVAYQRDTYDGSSVVQFGDPGGGGGWDLGSLSGSNRPETDVAYAIDGDGNKHVAFFDNGNRLLFASNASGGWVFQVVDGSTLDAGGVSIALDASNTPHLAYHDRDPSRLAYAEMTGPTAWDITTVDGDGTPGFHPDIALDSTGNAHVVYWAADRESVRYATNASGTWAWRNLLQDVGTHVGAGHPSIALDSAGNAHVSFTTTNFFGQELYHGSNEIGNWVLAGLTQLDVGVSSSIAVDADDRVHIAYAGATGLRHAVRSAPGRWVPSVIDTGGYGAPQFYAATADVPESVGTVRVPVVPSKLGPVFEDVDIAVSDSAVHVVGYDSENEDLRYVRSGAPATSTVSLDYDSTVAGTATQGEDFTPVAGTLVWRDQLDSGTKGFTVDVTDDREDEVDETFGVRLFNASGIVGPGPIDEMVFTVLDDDEFTFGGEVASFVLPKSVIVKIKANKPAKSTVSVRGTIDIGPDIVDYTRASTFSIGDIEIDLPPIAGSKLQFVHRAPGVKFTFRPSRLGSSRVGFTASVQRDLTGLVDPNGELTISWANGQISPSGRVMLTNGRFKLGKPVSALLDPPVCPTAVGGRVRGVGRDTFSLKFATPSMPSAPSEAPTVFLQFAKGFEQTVGPAGFKKKGNRWTYKGPAPGVTQVVIDYAKKTMLVKAKKTFLGPIDTGSSNIKFVAEFDGGSASASFRMGRRGTALRY